MRLADPRERALAAAITIAVKGTGAGRPHLDLVALLPLQRLDDDRRQPDREPVPPCCDTHQSHLLIYAAQRISGGGSAQVDWHDEWNRSYLFPGSLAQSRVGAQYAGGAL